MLTLKAKLKVAFCALALPFTAANAANWTVATDQNFPPYVFKDGADIKGIHYDIVAAVMKQMGKDYKLSAYPWARVVAVTDGNKVDFSFPWVGKPERFEKYLMIGPLHKGRTVFAVKSDSSISYNSLQDLKDYKIGTVRGYAYEKSFDDASFLRKDNQAKDNVAIIKKLTSGRVDMIIGDENVLREEARKLGVSAQIKYLDKAVKEASRYAAFPKANNAQAMEFKAALEAIKANGTYDKILKSYN